MSDRPPTDPFLFSLSNDYPHYIESVGELSDGRVLGFGYRYQFISIDRNMADGDEDLRADFFVKGGLHATLRQVTTVGLGDYDQPW